VVCSNELILARPAFWEAIFFGGYPQHLVQLARTLRMRFLRERYIYYSTARVNRRGKDAGLKPGATFRPKADRYSNPSVASSAWATDPPL